MYAGTALRNGTPLACNARAVRTRCRRRHYHGSSHGKAWHRVFVHLGGFSSPLRRDLITVSPQRPAGRQKVQKFSPSVRLPLAHVPDEPCGPALPCPASLPCPVHNPVELGPQTAMSTGPKLKKSARPLGRSIRMYPRRGNGFFDGAASPYCIGTRPGQAPRTEPRAKVMAKRGKEMARQQPSLSLSYPFRIRTPRIKSRFRRLIASWPPLSGPQSVLSVSVSLLSGPD